jgi:hypothetical protein
MSEDETIPMSEGESLDDLASQIVLWQGTAQQLPLAEVQDMASRLVNHLGCILNDFNEICLDEQRSDDALVTAVMEVARQAIAAAIFTLGASHRTRQEAALN